MSWTDIFPVLDDEMLDAYGEGVSEEERKQFEEWFGVDRGASLATFDNVGEMGGGAAAETDGTGICSHDRQKLVGTPLSISPPQMILAKIPHTST